MLSEAQRQTLECVALTLAENNIPFQVTGGLAAIAYGANRPLWDIDIDVSKKDIPKIRELFKGDIKDDYHHVESEHWDIYVMTLQINGVQVDFSQIEENYQIDKHGNRIGGCYDFSKAKGLEIEGIRLPVEDKEELVAYKKIIGRDTDLIDVRQITGD
jgi:hypothetical protein